jgi:hypothetical protein
MKDFRKNNDRIVTGITTRIRFKAVWKRLMAGRMIITRKSMKKSSRSLRDRTITGLILLPVNDGVADDSPKVTIHFSR